MAQKKKIFITLIIVIAVLFAWFFIRGLEDTWICEDGIWVKHGAPYAPMPDGDCAIIDNFNPFK